MPSTCILYNLYVKQTYKLWILQEESNPNVSSGVHEAVLIDDCWVSSPGRQMALRMRHSAVCSSYRGVNQTLIIRHHSTIAAWWEPPLFGSFSCPQLISWSLITVSTRGKNAQNSYWPCARLCLFVKLYFSCRMRGFWVIVMLVLVSRSPGPRIIDQWQLLEESWAENKNCRNSRNSFHPQHSMRSIPIKNLDIDIKY